MVTSNKTIAKEKVSFLTLTLPDAQKKSRDASMSTKHNMLTMVQVRRLNQFVMRRK